MSSRRPRHHEEEEHDNHERWLVTYADMVTLLMVFFIVMFAMSTVDEKKYMALKNGLAAGFANSDSVLPGSSSLLNESGTAPVAAVAPAKNLQSLQQLTDGAATPKDAADAKRTMQAMREAQRLRKAQAQVMEALKRHGLADDVQTTIDDRGLVISLVSKHVVFEADSALLSARGAAVVDALAPALLALPEALQIAGHTNQVAVQPANFATDWDLSAARATTVLRRLNEQLGLPEQRLSLAAYGHTQPLEDPSTPGSQAVNKRVDIVVLAGSDAETRQLMAEFAANDAAAADAAVEAAQAALDAHTNTQSSTRTSTHGAAHPAPGYDNSEGPRS